jgi:hypothetical protein
VNIEVLCCLAKKYDHFTTPAGAEAFYVQWVADRFAGKSAANGCVSQSQI